MSRRARARRGVEDLHHAPAGRRAAAGRVRRQLRGPGGRMRGAGRPVRRRQELDPEDDLRQLSLRRRAASWSIATAARSMSRRRSRGGFSRCAGETLGYVTQFLRAVPRVAAIDVVAEPLVMAGVPRQSAQQQAADLLSRLNIPERLWQLPPATFSGGEQQRVNIARGFLSDLPILLLDEPTASLDVGNRAVVVGLVAEKKRRGAADRRHRARRGCARRDRRYRDRRHPLHRGSLRLEVKYHGRFRRRPVECPRRARRSRDRDRLGRRHERAHRRDRRRARRRSSGKDLGGDLLLPGLVELHTDHLEAHYMPRPKVLWDPVAAVVSYDGQLATCGITTVLDSLRVWREEGAEDVDGQAGRAGRRHCDGARGRPAAHRSLPASALRIADARHRRGSEGADRAAGRPARCRSWTTRRGSGSSATKASCAIYYRGKNGGMTDAELDVLFAKRIEQQAAYAEANHRDIIDSRTRPRHAVGQPRRHHARACRRGDPRRRGDRGVSDHGRGGAGAARGRHPGADGRAQSGARRLARRQRGDGGPGARRRARRALVRLRAGEPADGGAVPAQGGSRDRAAGGGPHRDQEPGRGGRAWSIAARSRSASAPISFACTWPAMCPRCAAYGAAGDGSHELVRNSPAVVDEQHRD